MGGAIVGFGEFILTFLTFRTVAKNINLTRTGAAAVRYDAKEAAKIALKEKSKKAASNNKISQLNENPSAFVPPIKSIPGLSLKKIPLKTGLVAATGGLLYSKGTDVIDFLDDNKNTLFYAASAIILVGVVSKSLSKKKA